ncbi:hypothetical protein PEBR_05464 [Penicillium brasilianum]|uniref:Uncharacterized protein n=1 Tax=Penicillium brasilianum TaxID=104259 RepID=A0A1S9RXD0_PENBI|nr:hypothetical protein PEBR_05464 [Penicillium brasilianum]
MKAVNQKHLAERKVINISSIALQTPSSQTSHPQSSFITLNKFKLLFPNPHAIKMKYSITAIATLAAAAAAPTQYSGSQQYQQQPWQYTQQQNKYSPAEAQAWHTCIDRLLDQFNAGNTGSSVSCSTFKCLDETAAQYSRGGALAGLGQVVSLACNFGGIIPVRNHPPIASNAAP